MDFFLLLSLLKAKGLQNCSESSGGHRRGNKTVVCGVERRAKERRRPHFSSIGVSDKTSTGREAKQHNLECRGGDAHEATAATKDTMSATKRTNKTWILRTRQRRSKPADDEQEVTTNDRSGAVVRRPTGEGNTPAWRHSGNLIKQT